MRNTLNSFLNLSIFSNTSADYLYSLFIFLAALSALYILRSVIFKKLEALSRKTETDLDDLLVRLVKKIKTPDYQLIAFYLAVKNLETAPAFDYLLKLLLLLVFTYRGLIIIEDLFSYWISKLENRKDQPLAALQSVKIIFRILLWFIAALFILHNAGVKIGAVLTSLGIGGVAVALAAQTILGDIFNFFVILMDKPFKTGDFIILSGNVMGTVEQIGLKSTKIRSLSGELITVTNTKVFADLIQNYAHMKERRVVVKIGVVYRTGQDKLKIIPGIIKESVEKFEKTRFDRANLSKLNDYSIDFEFVFYLSSPDYGFYMKTQESVILEIFERFRKEEIEFAYPTQTLFVEQAEGARHKA